MTCMVWKLIRNDKKWNLWMAGLFVLLFAAVFLVNDIFYSARSDLLEQNQSRYGRHHGIFFDVDRNEIETAEKEDVSQSGWICLTGAFGISGRQAKVSGGYFDPGAMEMEKLSVIKGHMPERKDEIAVEKSRLIKFGKNVSIGSSVTLIDENGRKRTYTISGIIKDYSGAWEVPDHVTAGRTALPEVFVKEGSYPPKAYHFIFRMKWGKFEYDSLKIWELADNAGVAMDHAVCNQKTYEEGMERIQDLGRIQNVFLAVLAAAILLLEICLLPVYFGKYKKAYHTFWLCGMESRRILHSKLIHYLLLMGMSAAGTAVLYLTVSAMIQKVWMTSYVHHISLWILAAVMFLMAAGFYFFAYKTEEKNAFAAGIPVCRRWSMTVSCFFYSIRKGWKGIVPALILGVFMSLAVFYSLAYLHDFDDGDWNRTPDFSMLSRQTSVSVSSGDFRIYQNLDSYFTVGEVQKLEAMDGVSGVRKVPFTDGLSLNFKKGQMKDYWKQFLESTESTTNIVPDHGVVPVYDLDFYVLDAEELEKLEKKEPKESWERLREKDTIVMILPETENGGGHGIKEGEKVIFERIEYDQELDLQELKRSDIREEMYQKTVARIRTHPLENGVLNMELGRERPAVILLEENAGDMIKGYGGIDVYLGTDIRPDQYRKIEETTKDMAAGQTDFYWSSRREQQEEYKKILRSIQIPMTIFGIGMCSVLSALTWISCRIHLDRIRNTVRIFWTYGMKEKEIARAVTMELACYGGIELAVSLLGITGMLWILAGETPFHYPAILGGTAGVIVCLWAVLICLVRKYGKINLLQ